MIILVDMVLVQKAAGKQTKRTTWLNKKLRYRKEHSASVVLCWCTLQTPEFLSLDSRDPFLQVLVSVLVLNLGVLALALEPSSLGLGTSDHGDHDTLQWLTVTAEIELLLNMVWCFVVYCMQLPVCCIFCLPWLFQSYCLSQSIPVMDFQYWSCKVNRI